MRWRNSRVGCGLMLVAILCSSSAFAGLPDGFEIHKDPKGRFAIALPEGWATYDQGKKVVVIVSARAGITNELIARA